MQLWDSITGCVRCRVVSASLEDTINKITSKCNIANFEQVDALTATFWVKRVELANIYDLAERVDVIEYAGIYWEILNFFKRPIIVIGITIILFLVLFLPTRVLFIRVYGNNKVSVESILVAAQSCGVQFGAYREQIRSEKVKNALLQTIPQLQWACINTKGCTAEIFVQERNFGDGEESRDAASLVAANDGIIAELTVFSGTPLCSVGQAVKKGQLLVSGYSDLGLLIKSGTASAEIIADTTRAIETIALCNYTQNKEVIEETRRYSLCIGKKLINFYKGSGISPPECGRINKIYRLKLPGGFYLPVSIVEERIIYYESVICTDQGDQIDWLQAVADSAICKQMVAGEILKQTATVEWDGNVCRLYSKYRCKEMIAIPQSKEMYTVDEARN